MKENLREVSRRDFLKMAGLVLSAAGLAGAGCGSLSKSGQDILQEGAEFLGLAFSPSRTSKEIVRDVPFKILILGDSNTSMREKQIDLDGNPQNEDLYYQDHLKKILEERYQRADIQITSEGYGGGATACILNPEEPSRGGLESEDKLQEILDQSPDLIILAFGTNDIKKGEEGIKNYEICMKEAVDYLVKAGKTILLATPVGGYDYRGYRRENGERILEVNQDIAQLNPDLVGVVDIWSRMEPEKHILGNNPENYVHLNAEGHLFVAQMMVGEIERMGLLREKVETIWSSYGYWAKEVFLNR